MAFQDDFDDRTVEVVLRCPDENGMIDTTDREVIETETRSLIFERDADGGIGNRKHLLAFVTWVVPLEEGKYRLEDMWYGHFLKTNGEEEAPGGLAFRDVFLAERLADGSLVLDRVVEKANWRIDYWMLPSPSFVRSPYLRAAVAKIEAYGGRAEQDPWIGNWLWTFLPPESGYDPTDDIAEALDSIPRSEIERARKELLEAAQRSDDEST